MQIYWFRKNVTKYWLALHGIAINTTKNSYFGHCDMSTSSFVLPAVSIANQETFT